MSLLFPGMLFSSGLGATNTMTHLLSAGEHLIAMSDLYGGENINTCLVQPSEKQG